MKKTMLGAAPILAVLCACAATPAVKQPQQQEQWREQTEKALGAARRKDFAEAERLHFAALSMIKELAGNEGPVVKSLNHLAALYASAGRADGARGVLEKAAPYSESALGPDHPDTLLTLRNLARVQEPARAEEILSRVIRSVESRRSDDPELPGLRLERGTAMLAQDKNTEAEAEFGRALAAAGADHPDFAALLDAIARAYVSRRSWERAEAYLVRAVAVSEKAMGPDHPNVAASLQNLAGVLVERSMAGRAEPLYRRALAIWEKQFGPDHPAVAACKSELARVSEGSRK